MAAGALTIRRNDLFRNGADVDAYECRGFDFLPKFSLLAAAVADETAGTSTVAFTGLAVKPHFFVLADSDPSVYIRATPDAA